MTSSRSKDVNLPIIGRARGEPFSQLKLLTNGEVLQRYIYYLKVLKVTKNEAMNFTCDEVVDLWKKVSDGCARNYTCYKTIKSVKTLCKIYGINT